MFTFSKLDSKVNKKYRSKSPFKRSSSFIKVKTLCNNQVYQARKDKQANKKMDLTQALAINTTTPSNAEYS